MLIVSLSTLIIFFKFNLTDLDGNKVLGKKAMRNYMPLQKGDVKQTLSNTNLLKKITRYNPKTNFKTGIRKFLDWYLEYYN